MIVMDEAYYFILIAGGKLARNHLSICSKYLRKPEKNRGRDWGQTLLEKKLRKQNIEMSTNEPSCTVVETGS